MHGILLGSVAFGANQGPSRVDFLVAYERFEKAWTGSAARGVGRQEVDESGRARASVALDRAVAQMAHGNVAAAVAGIDAAQVELLGNECDPFAVRELNSLRMELIPAYGTAGKSGGPVVRLTRLYEPESGVVSMPGNGKVGFEVVLLDGEGRVQMSALREYRPGGARALTVELDGDLVLRESGNYSVELRDAMGVLRNQRKWPMLRQDPALSAFILSDQVKGGQGVLTCSGPGRGVEVFLGRVTLLDPATKFIGARFEHDLHVLESSLSRELNSLCNGNNPYVDLPGKLWRIARIAGLDVPTWIVAPRFDPKMPAPPAVLALHGAGLDENQWMSAYGQGELARLARERRFLLILPRTECLLGASEWLKGLLLDVGREYYFDRARVFMIGHGDGAAAAAGAANRDPELVAGLALLGGGENLIPSDRLPPVLYALGGLDQIAPNGQIRIAAERAHAAGARVNVLELKGHGHMTLVPQSLKAALALLGL